MRRIEFCKSAVVVDVDDEYKIINRNCWLSCCGCCGYNVSGAEGGVFENRVVVVVDSLMGRWMRAIDLMRND